MNELEKKQDELIYHYKVFVSSLIDRETEYIENTVLKKPLVSDGISLIVTANKVKRLESEIAALKQQDKYCKNCKYYKISFQKPPCSDCSRESLWEAKSCDHKDTTIRYGIMQCADCGKPIDTLKQQGEKADEEKPICRHCGLSEFE